MIEYPIKDANNQELRSAQLNEAVFGRKVRGDLLAQAVTYQLAKRRDGNAKTKGRSDVSGGGHKPYRQKGTGNARQGTVRAPQFRTGGIVFGPLPRDHSIKMPKKARRLALQIALSAKREAGELIVVDALALAEAKTKAMSALLKQLEVSGTALIVIPEEDTRVQLAARNIPGIGVIRVEGVNVYDVLAHQQLIVTEAALQKLEERLA